MKRIGVSSKIIEQIIAYENISNSIDVVLAGSRRKTSRTGKAILAHRDEIIAMLGQEIRSGSFELGAYREKLVTDGPKIRKVQSVSLIKRIACHAIMAVVEKAVFPMYIRTTAASIPGRGVHDLYAYIRRDFSQDPENMKYYYQGDISKFYENIDQDIMMQCLRRIFKDPTLLTILEKMVRMTPTGLSIGLRSSQGFGNILLSVHLDHHVKDKLGCKHYYRYCDDIIVFAASKEELWRIRNSIHQQLQRINLQIKSGEQIRPSSSGLDFLGYVIFPDHARLRKRNKKNAAKRLHSLKSASRRHQITASLYGQCKHAECKNLFYRLTGTTMEEFKKLSELGIKPKFTDGKKRFDCKEIKLSDLDDNTEILILDFEEGIITKPLRDEYNRKVSEQRRLLQEYTNRGMTPPDDFTYPDQVERPVGKYLVSATIDNGYTKQTVKFFIGDQENKSILDQLREQGLLGKTLCTVKRIHCKGFNRYVLQ